MKISVGLLAYNSERWIVESAGCLQPYVDEVFVLVDDATTDHTEDILDMMNIRHERYSWKNDFASAKNTLISKLTGDWVIVLDDDEKLSNYGATSLVNLIQSLNEENKWNAIQIARKQQYPYWTVNDNEFMDNIYPDPHIQAFKHLKEYYYERPVHEGLAIPMDKVLPWEQSANMGIFIYHHAWRGNRDKWEAPKHRYYEDLTKGKNFEKGEKYF